ncbi:MAG TPA: type II secretion system ATPase GspE [Pseudomonadota bacterium]|nr:type II secretion system ATPase GspE [Pseudomonadota bacterium]HNN52882.1 type II secretion system ATPase GspE [Pseudomonadota bacterium]
MGKSDKPEGRATASGPLSGTVAAKSSGQHSVLPTSKAVGAAKSSGQHAVLVPSRPVSARSLGALLQKHAGLSEVLLREALSEQEDLRRSGGGQTEGTRLGEILLRRRSVTEEQVLRALGHQFGLDVLLEIRPDTIDQDLVQRIPINFAKQHTVVLLRRNQADDTVEAAIADPTAVHVLDDIARVVLAEVSPYLAPAHQILEAINKVYSRAGIDAELQKDEETTEEAETEEDVDLVDVSDEAPIIRWVNSVIFHAVRVKASDIHFEPREKDMVVRYRIDNVLEEYKKAPRTFINSIVARVKIMAGLNIAEKRLPQDGRIRRKIAGKDIDMRVATVPTAFGERITVRLLDKSSVLLDLADLGFGADHLETMVEMINRPHGILLVTGPTGSGKTTTLYAALSKINTPDINILTVEDPVEYQLEGISQVQVNPKIDLTFAAAIRSFLRHDPDVIMVGEIRDQETASMAITASLTGHLVFSTIHTNDAAGAVTRLVDMGIEPFLVTSSLMGVLAQRLVRRLCIHCRETYKPTATELSRLAIPAEDFFAGRYKVATYITKAPPPPPGHLYRAREGGCNVCSQRGYQGRSAIYELLEITDAVRELSLKKADAATLKKAAIHSGMRTLRTDGAGKVLAGITSIEEVMLVTAEDKE